jgi:hypothetical protein
LDPCEDCGACVVTYSWPHGCSSVKPELGERAICNACWDGRTLYGTGGHMLDCPKRQRDGFRAAATEDGA